jgi:predicted permease
MSVIGECRTAIRRWSLHRGVVAAIVVALSAGVAASTTAFAMLNAVLLHPYEWRAPEQLVAAYSTRLDRQSDPAWAATWNRQGFSWSAWRALQHSPALTDAAVWFRDSVPLILGDDRSSAINAIGMSSNLPSTLGVPIVRGRSFTPNEDTALSDSVMLSHAAWQTRFGGREDIVGTRITLSRFMTDGPPDQRTVVGIMADTFRLYGDTPDVILPIGSRATSTTWSLRVVGRLAPGMSMASAQPSIEAITRASEPSSPTGARLISLTADQSGNAGASLWALFAGALLLLGIAAANVAGLLLAEGEMRRHEVSVRFSLGGRVRDLVRQFTIEHVLLAIVTSVAGAVLAYWLIRALVAQAPSGLPGLERAHLDLRIFAFACGVAVVTLLLAGIVPVISLSRTRALALSTAAGRGQTHGGQRRQQLLVASQFALAIVLSVGASLFAGNVLRLDGRPLGFDPSHLLVVSTMSTVRDAAQTDAAIQSALERVASVPGVAAAASTMSAPFTGEGMGVGVRAAGRAEEWRAQRQLVSPRYFPTLRMAALEGRVFDTRDAGANVAVVSETFAHRYLDDHAVGRRFADVSFGGERELTVIGVVPDVRERRQSDEPRPTFYALGGASYGLATFVVRTNESTVSVASIRNAIAGASPQLIATTLSTMDDVLAQSMAEYRFRTRLALIFGGAALVLSMAGLYGLMARRVAHRQRELGVRAALGASPANVRQLIVREALIIAAAGIAIGLPLAFALSQSLRAWLVAISPTEISVYGGATLLVAVTALVAAIIPAWSASRINLASVLRE